jgi:hypothetical protein
MTSGTETPACIQRLPAPGRAAVRRTRIVDGTNGGEYRRWEHNPRVSPRSDGEGDSRPELPIACSHS